MEYSFPHYLLAKQSVDDRALNHLVYTALETRLAGRAGRVIEVGAGVGTMLMRLLRRGLFEQVDYVMVDEMAENITFALEWLPAQAGELGLLTEKVSDHELRFFDASREVRLRLERADVFEFIRRERSQADLLIAHAFLDLLPMPGSLESLFSLVTPGGLAWLTINFDGATIFEPAVEPALDGKIEQLYHQTMDERSTGGDSRSGRHLFGHLAKAGAQVLAAGPSDWVVYAENGKYPADESYFLEFILHFFEDSLAGHAGIKPAELAGWLAERRAQLQRGELVYIAHQMDFLVQPRRL